MDIKFVFIEHGLMFRSFIYAREHLFICVHTCRFKCSFTFVYRCSIKLFYFREMSVYNLYKRTRTCSFCKRKNLTNICLINVFMFVQFVYRPTHFYTFSLLKCFYTQNLKFIYTLDRTSCVTFWEMTRKA